MWLSAERLLRGSGPGHSFEPLPQRIVHNLLKGCVSRFPNLFDEYRDIIVKAQCGSHTSKHTRFDALMLGWRYDWLMRITITLDPEVERLIREVMRTRSISFRQALNDAVRAGLTDQNTERGARFVQQTFHMGEVQKFRWDKALAVAYALNDEELTRGLS